VLLMGIAFLPLLVGSFFLPLPGGPVALVVNVLPILLATVILTLGTLVVRPFQMALIPVLANDRLLGTYTGVFWMWSGIGATAGNFLVGLAFDAQRTSGLVGLPWALLVTLGVLSALSIWRVLRSGPLAPAASSESG